MRALALSAAEIRHRPWQSILALAGVVAAVSVPVFWLTAGDAANRETTRLMRDMGYNLRIVPGDTDLDAYWRDGHAKTTMPEEAVRRFRNQKDVSYNHLIALLVERIDWRGVSVLVTGLAPEVAPKGKKKSPMIFTVAPGTAYVGSEPARRLKIAQNDTIELHGHAFRVEQCLAETGTRDDVRIWLSLADAQKVLQEPERINEIKALECYCADPGVDNTERLRADLARIVPEGRVLRMEAIAEARERQRRMSERFLALVLPVVLLLCGLLIAALAMLNVRERQGEVGILRALGYGSGHIASLFMAKAFQLGAIGGLLGWAIGTGAAMALGPEMFATKAGTMRPSSAAFGIAVPLAPLFAALASLVPTLLAVRRDPADVLREAA